MGLLHWLTFGDSSKPIAWPQQAQFQAIRPATGPTGSVSETRTPHIQPLNGYPRPPFDRERFIFKLLAVVIITQLTLYTVATGVCGNVAYIRRQHLVEVCPRVLDQVTAAFDATMKLLIALLGGAALRNGGR